MAKRSRASLKKTILCAVRFWGHMPWEDWGSGGLRGTLKQGVRHVVRKQGFSTSEIYKTEKELQSRGLIVIDKHTIRLTPKGSKGLSCSAVKLAPWTDDPYPGSSLSGKR